MSQRVCGLAICEFQKTFVPIFVNLPPESVMPMANLLPVSNLPPVLNFPQLSMTPVAICHWYQYTGGKFAPGVSDDTGGAP
jgi:hypothetical protein